MCGIFSVFNIQDSPPKEADFLKAIKLAAHRGPDNIGFFNDGFCFLGHTRLSIIDVDESSNQPFHFENLVIVFNGEIFNFIELRDELSKLGYQFETQSDTEVAIKAFHKWGVECFSKFNGMWALIIYDKTQKIITVSRDRFGQKPLFIMRNGKTTYFASEVQQLVPFSDRKADLELIQMFLKEGLYNGGGRTFFTSIETFPKAHYWQIDSHNTSYLSRYWSYWSGPVQRTSKKCYKDFSNLLKDAIAIRLRADVPYGILLSGGVDSTIIAGFASKITKNKIIPLFTYASDDLFDESRYALKVADQLGMPLTIRKQDKSPLDYRERLKKLVFHMGRGHSSPAIVSVDYLYESVARSGVKVALDGQGADELLAGYKTYYPLIIALYILRLHPRQSLYFTIRAFHYGIPLAVILFLRNILPPWAKKISRSLYGYERFFQTYNHVPPSQILKPQPLNAANTNIINRYLIRQHELGLENLLFYGDIASMRHSVENRSPFLDHRLVDFVFKRCERMKLWNGFDKYALRKTPIYMRFNSILDRKKIGFSSDINNNTKLAMIMELESSPILHWPIFSKKLSIAIRNKLLLQPKYERLLFRIFQVHLWNEIFCPQIN